MTSIKEQQCLYEIEKPGFTYANPKDEQDFHVLTTQTVDRSTEDFQQTNSPIVGNGDPVIENQNSLPDFDKSLLGEHLQEFQPDINFKENQTTRLNQTEPQNQAVKGVTGSGVANEVTVPNVDESILGDAFNNYRQRPDNQSQNYNFDFGTTTVPLFETSLISISLTSDFNSSEGQDMVSDEQILEQFKTDQDEHEFYQQLLDEYEKALLAEDVQGMAQFEQEIIHFSGRFVPHFDRDCDGKRLLRSLRSDIERSVSRASGNRVSRIRSAYATYYQYASGKKGFREMISNHYLSELTSPFQVPKAQRQLLKQRNSKGLLPGKKTSDIVIYRSTVGPAGVTRLGPGQIRVFTGQSRTTFRSMIKNGLQLRTPKHPGRAHYGKGVYTTQQRSIAESYKAQHADGVIAQATPKVTNLKALNITTGPGKDAFEAYLNSVPGLRQAWKVHENRYAISENFISSYAPDVDIVIAPHGVGNQFIFRTSKALAALELSVAQ